MGEVYRARDTRLGRDVAVKLLPSVLADDPDRRARFERESRLLAALNHPHIAAIHSVEEIDGRLALILELVEGPTLADRLATGPIPIAEALQIARQLAEALEAAHGKGVVHRDLKPSNVKITSDGAVKLLDFGLAKATPTAIHEGDAQLRSADADPTHDGVILGTGAYMSPEQARGQAVDKRTDVWAFGCVLYEMLTGRRAFSGDTISDTIAAILDREPDWTALPPALPPEVQRLVRRCLQKDPTPPDPRHRGCPRRDRRGVGRRERASCLTDARDLGEPPDARDLCRDAPSRRCRAIACRVASRIASGRSIRRALTDIPDAPTARRCWSSISADGFS